MSQSEKVILRIGGVNWEGWESVEVSRQVDAAAGSFSLGLADKWRAQQMAPAIAAGMACEVSSGGGSLISGYIDNLTINFSPGAHGLTVSGRDKTADLVDCSAVHEPGFFQKQTVEQLANTFAGPFNVSVKLEEDPGQPIEIFKIEEGETAFMALDRAARLRGLLPTPDGRGGLSLGRPGKKRSSTALRQGENVKEGSVTYDVSDRHSDYICKGQKRGTDDDYGENCCCVKGEGKDESIDRYRPLIVRPETQVNEEDAEQRAKWEASTRAARGVTAQVTVQGWRQDGGQLWEPGLLVNCDLPFLHLSRDLMIAKVTFSLSMGEGTVTKLDLKDPKAFDKDPPKKSGKGGGGKGGAGKGHVELQQESAESGWSAHKDITGEI
ncbi:hypothetical protein LJB86_02665 [Deltaproteobacteria bacterium OttesenSCG-928-M10]|nr:hypothetical protein [Deltaproteobacteria bacterium OttesenSCG-928-M10]